MKRLVLVLGLLTTGMQLSAQNIPAGRSINWAAAGNSVGFPASAPVVNILSFGGSQGGTSDNAAALMSAIASLGGHAGIVYFPAGNYLFNSGIAIPDSVLITGAGSDSTRLLLNHTSVGFSFAGSAPGSFSSVLWGAFKDSSRVRVQDPTFFAAGDYCEIRQDNGSWDSNPATWATHSVGQVLRIAAVKGDTLIFTEALHISYSLSLNPEVRRIVPRRCSGFSCIEVERTHTSNTSSAYNFQFYLAVNCFLSGTESNKSHGSHCMIGLSAHITIAGCYFHDAVLYDGSGTKGYGVTLNEHSCLCLIENNAFRHLRHAMMTKHGANGNVFSGNYSIEPYRNGSMEFPQDYCGDISLHGHYSFANLFEGNVVQTIFVDDYWGPSGPGNTFIRNRAELYGILCTSAQTHEMNIIGNEITGTGFTFPFSHGAYSLSGSSHYEYGNNRTGTLIPSGTGGPCTVSGCYASQPSFWDAGSAWPAMGPPNSLNSGTIPAQVHFASGNYTICSTGAPVTGQNSEIPCGGILSVWPNPCSGTINIGVKPGTSVMLKVYDVCGNLRMEMQTFSATANLGSLPPGLYLLMIVNGGRSYVQKIILQ